MPGTSSAVMIASTPSIFQRGATGRSTRCGRTGAASAAWRPTGSRRRTGRDENANAALHLGDAVGSGRAVAERPVTAGSAPRPRWPPGRRRSCAAAPTRVAGDRHPLHGVDDPAVAGAAADVARQLLADLDLARLRRCGRAGRASAMIRPGRAEPALHRAGVDEGLLHVARRADRGDALDRDDRLADRRRRRAPGTSTRARRRPARCTSRTRPARTRPSRPSARAARAARTSRLSPTQASRTSRSVAVDVQPCRSSVPAACRRRVA